MSDRRYDRPRKQLLERLRERGIQDLDVLHAVANVPRHAFVPSALAHRAYEDAALPIGFGQTISQPSIQALYLQLLQIRQHDRVLEVGTGSGYQTALLARLAAQVFSVERIRELSVRARRALDGVGARNVALLVGDGSVGWARYAPFDAILVAAGSPDVPAALREQLAERGRMLVPVGDREAQILRLVSRSGASFHAETITECAFVPLVGRFGWSEGHGARSGGTGRSAELPGMERSDGPPSRGTG